MADRISFIRLPGVCERTGLARSTIYRLIGAGLFPSPIRVSARASAWIASEIDDWIARRIRASRAS